MRIWLKKKETKWRNREIESKNKANISIDIRRPSSDLTYLSMDDLANLVEKVKDPLKLAGLSRDATEYKPMRDAVAHTALLTDSAKKRLTAVYENIKARIRALLSTPWVVWLCQESQKQQVMKDFQADSVIWSGLGQNEGRQAARHCPQRRHFVRRFIARVFRFRTWRKTCREFE